MRLAAMKYKSFVWPNNPRVYSIDFQRDVAVHKIPGGTAVMEDLGRSCRVMRGEGEFFGEDAYDNFKKLATLFYENGAGMLIHPVWQPAMAYFTALELRQEPRADYVAYSFEFWEDCGLTAEITRYDEVPQSAGAAVSASGTAASASAAVGSGERRVHVVVSGDTLWAIAQRYSVSLDTILALNPQIKNPNLIYTGEQVRLA